MKRTWLWVVVVLPFLPNQIGESLNASRHEVVRIEKSINFLGRGAKILSSQPDTILYDDNTPYYLYPDTGLWSGVRFTPDSLFELRSIYFVIHNLYNQPPGCTLYVTKDSSGFPSSVTLAGPFYVSGPLPDLSWIQVDLPTPLLFGPGEDFHIIYGPQPGGYSYPQDSTQGWWNVLDSSTTTYRSHVSPYRETGWETNTYGDFLLRAGGEYLGVPSDFQIFGESGGRAPWTRLVKLKIDSTGFGSYWIMPPEDRDSGVYTLVDTFQLDSNQLASLYASVIEHGFFGLDSLYDGDMTDGTFCDLKITANGITHKVVTTNIRVPAFDSLVLEINAITPGNLDLFYNELNYPGLPGHGTFRKRGGIFPGIRETDVFVEACTIRVVIWLELAGPCATQDLFNDWEQNIENVWNRNQNYFHVDSCPVVFNVQGHVQDTADTLPTPGYHHINVPCDTSANGDSFISHVHKPLPQPNGASGSGCWDDNEPANTPAHEAGHLMGLSDQYQESTYVDSAGDTVRVTNPFPGHENDLMATLDGEPTQAAVESVVSNGGVACPDTCCPVGIVDDDQGLFYESCYQQALDELNINYRTYAVDPGSSGPPLEILEDHAVIIWLTGDDDMSTLLPEDAQNLMGYLDQGGKLLISGQNIGFDVWNYPTDPITQAFYTDYLHAEYVQDNVGLYQLKGKEGTFLEGILGIGIEGGDCANNQFSPSEIDPLPPAFTVLEYDTSEGPGLFEVIIQDYQFNPSYLNIPQGSWVRWTNLDPVQHTSTSDQEYWDTGPIDPGSSSDIFFDFSPGIYPYHCADHPEEQGVVEVTLSRRRAKEKGLIERVQKKKPEKHETTLWPISSGSGGIGVEIPQGLDTARVVYFSFGFEAMDGSALRDSVMSRVLAWLLSGEIPSFTCGDMNCNGGIGIDDLIYLASYLFAGSAPPCSMWAADVNCSGSVGIDDLIYLASYLFAGGLPPDCCN